LVAKLNDIPSEDAQWYRADNKHQLFNEMKLFYHSEKLDYIKRANDKLMSHEQGTILVLRRQLMEKDKEISELRKRVQNLTVTQAKN
jgi:hypothetical protein